MPYLGTALKELSALARKTDLVEIILIRLSLCLEVWVTQMI